MCPYTQNFPGGSVVKNLPASVGDAGDLDSVHGSVRSPEERNGDPLQDSCLENPRRARRATFYEVAKELDMM